MGRQWLNRKGNYILKSNLPIGVQNMTLKSIDKNISSISIDSVIKVIIIIIIIIIKV